MTVDVQQTMDILGDDRDKYLSQRKSSKKPLFPCQITTEDSAIFEPPTSLFSLHLCTLVFGGFSLTFAGYILHYG